MTQLIWTPPVGDPLTFDTAADAVIRLTTLDGIGAVSPELITRRGPGQEGATALDVTVPSRIVAVQAIVRTADRDALWTTRALISRAFSVRPVRFGSEIELGTLTLRRDSFDDRELDAVARSLDQQWANDMGWGTLDAEWLCPYPYWRDVTDSTVASIASGASGIAANAGDVDASIVATIHGPATSATLTNVTTGRSLTAVVDLPTSAYRLEVDTSPERIVVQRVNETTGVVENAIGGLDATSTLWLLEPGNNTVAFTAVGGSGSTHASLAWRNRYAGL